MEFSASTTSGSNTWRTGASLIQAYTSAVITDAPYAFHRFDEASGAVAADSSGNNRAGTYAAVATYRQTGALPHNTGLGGASTSKLLVSPTALNNGVWHHLVVTAVPSGSNEASAMYVDGVLVASGNTTKASLVYSGWWRVGFGRVPTGTGYPTTGNFTGSVDDFAV
jgi:hypothetical protein